MIYLYIRYVWPWAQLNTISHDSHYCESYPSTTSWPTKREYNITENFVGAPFNSPPMENFTEKCPKKCRPFNHPDWDYC